MINSFQMVGCTIQPYGGDKRSVVSLDLAKTKSLAKKHPQVLFQIKARQESPSS